MDRLIKEDSPEPELEALSTTDSLSVAPSEENILEETTGKRTPGRKTPSGRSRTPIFGKHRNRHKSTGSSPAPSLKSHGTAAAKSPKLCHQRTLSQPEVTSPTSSHAANGYEPVGKDRITNSQSVGKLPQSRPPDSQLPTIPNDGDDSDTAESCFPLRKSRSRSRSRERKTKKTSARSQSRDSRWSDPDHPYETPKLLPKHQRREEDRRSKSHQEMSLVEYGYEPIGRPNPVFSQKPQEDAAVSSTEKLTETDTILHLSRHNDGNLKTTASETKQGKTLLNNLIDKVKKLSKEESHALIKRKDSKEDKTVTSKIDDNDHPAVSKLEEDQEQERRKKEIQETEKRALKEAEKQLKEEEKKQKKEQERAQEQEKRRLKEEAKILKKEQDAEQLRLRKMKEEQDQIVKKEKEVLLKQQKIKAEEERQKKEQERILKQAQEQEKRRLKEEAKNSKREQDAEQLRLRKLKEEQEKIAKREKEDQLKQQKIKEAEEKEEAKRLKKAEEIEQKNLKKIKEQQEKQLRKEKEEFSRQQKLKEEEKRRRDEEEKKLDEETQKKLVKAEKEEEEVRLKEVREQTKKRENEIRVHLDPEDKVEPIYADEVPSK